MGFKITAAGSAERRFCAVPPLPGYVIDRDWRETGLADDETSKVAPGRPFFSMATELPYLSATYLYWFSLNSFLSKLKKAYLATSLFLEKANHDA